MATQTDITTGFQTVSATGAVTGTLDTSALSGDSSIKLCVNGLAAGQTAQVAIEDTASATPFNDAHQVAVFHVQGQVQSQAEAWFAKRQYEIPATRFGAANTKLRANVLALSGGNLSLRALIEQ
jgi:hypothetical protein